MIYAIAILSVLVGLAATSLFCGLVDNWIDGILFGGGVVTIFEYREDDN